MSEGNMIGREGGLVVAKSGDKCPVFKDEIPSLAITLVGRSEDYHDLEYWLEYVKGLNCITRKFESEDGYIALRAEHQSVHAQLVARVGNRKAELYR